METLTQILADWGYWGLFLSAAIAGSIVPFSSEAVLALLLGVGAHPLWCLLAASTGNTLGGMTCYWIGKQGRPERIARLGIKPRQLARARKFMAVRGAAAGFFCFLPVIGEAIALLLGLMRADAWITGGTMLAGKTLRYLTIVLSYEGIARLF
ncbi:MAG: VTT domain-containing protein [Alistipes sp.]|nr:VTT domain-containing protein [Alistipes sp.]MDE5692057.1 VTT domain-containing protein [Alistipes sp.]MDE5695640.1 VTT domain-containing protein [Alistipes sp.]MDE6507225.1 VTT domain-containing protein [Alistipes sp.]MDE7077676.1 VTT domain-containing protein [Alistipes sp.]